jgi:hypothetical protein
MPSEESQLSKRHHLEDPTRVSLLRFAIIFFLQSLDYFRKLLNKIFSQKTSNQKLQTPRSDAEVLSLFGYSKGKCFL